MHFTPLHDRVLVRRIEGEESGVNASPAGADGSSEFESLSIDDEGLLILVWPRGVRKWLGRGRHWPLPSLLQIERRLPV